MNSVTLAFMIAGLLAFAAGAWFAGTGERTFGIGFMMGGLALQVLTLVRLKQDKKRGLRDASR